MKTWWCGTDTPVCASPKRPVLSHRCDEENAKAVLLSAHTITVSGMFETVVPDTFRARSRRVFYQTLPVSIAVHAVAIAGLAAAALWSIVFPSQSPRMTVPYNLTRLPDPPPPPPPLRAQPAAAGQTRQLSVAPPRPLPIVAPTIIPDTIPPVVEPPPPIAIPEPMTEAVQQPAAATAGGASNGLPDGSIGGKRHGTAGGLVLADDGRVHIELGEKLPLFPVDQTYPRYPEEARRKRLEDRVVLRYVIGTNGRVIDISILEHAKEPMFDEEALSAIKAWRFRPLTLNGKRAEVVHELAVNFEFIVR